jgi:DNA-directed RNA polymerase specialized sigma24 family protein
VEGFSQKEIAEIMNTSEGTIKSQVFKAKARLRKTMRDDFPGRARDEV